MSERRCKARDASGFWWGADSIDPSEPGFVNGKGVFFPETVPCYYMPLPGEDLCYRHSFLIKSLQKAMAEDNEVTA